MRAPGKSSANLEKPSVLPSGHHLRRTSRRDDEMTVAIGNPDQKGEGYNDAARQIAITALFLADSAIVATEGCDPKSDKWFCVSRRIAAATIFSIVA